MLLSQALIHERNKQAAHNGASLRRTDRAVQYKQRLLHKPYSDSTEFATDIITMLPLKKPFCLFIKMGLALLSLNFIRLFLNHINLKTTSIPGK